jgi:hypothetical protein
MVRGVRTIELVGGFLDGATLRVPSDVNAIPLIEKASSAVEFWYVERQGDPFHFDLQRTRAA